MPGSMFEDPDLSPTANQAAPHRYDSFVVRIWMSGGERFARVQVRHVQSDTLETATMVNWDWVAQAMDRLMEPESWPPE